MRRVLAAFRKDLARAGIGPRLVEQRVATIAAFVQEYPLAQTPPRGLLDLRRTDLHEYLTTAGRSANQVSFRRLVRFLAATGRLDYEAAAELAEYLRHA